jgi:translation initiation factor IF-3
LIKRYKKRPEERKFYRTNQQIAAQTLRVLDSEGKQIGVLGKFEAIDMARAQELDLVEIAAMAKPPVAKIIDFKKFLYQEAKKKREEKKKAKTTETKEVRLGPLMDDHDLMVMVNRARGFLEDGDKVRFVMKFAGRQITHPEIGEQVLSKAIKELEHISKTEREKHFEGRQMITILTPERKSQNAKEENKEISQQAI